MIKAIFMLPFMAVVVMPGFLHWLSAGTGFGGRLSQPGEWTFWAGGVLLGAGLFHRQFRLLPAVREKKAGAKVRGRLPRVQGERSALVFKA